MSSTSSTTGPAGETRATSSAKTRPERAEPPVAGHAIDGIQEYDNPLPGWWVGIFWATIVFAPAYVAYYHVGPGQLVRGEYEAEAAAARAADAERAQRATDVTEEGLASLMADPATVTRGAALFAQSCAACHGAQGEGKIGPNLTDEAWIHGGTLVAIHTTISRGVPERGMLAWGALLPPDDVRVLAAFVGSRRGLNVPGPLPPQGPRGGGAP